MAAHLDLTARIGSVVLPNPVMTASGTAGHGAELGRYLDLCALGAVVVKSLSAEPWAGNPPPRVHETTAGMLNSVGLQNPGVEAWLADELPGLIGTGARVVASIWGFTVEAYEKAAAMLADAPSEVVAVEINLSCPNVESRRHMFAHDAGATADVVAATAGARRPRWAKLSPNVTDVTEIAGAAVDAGADAVTLVNTVMGLAIDPVTRKATLGNFGGGLSGAAIRPVAVRAINDVHRARPDATIVGVGGVTRAEDVVELMLAGATAVQIGTATFRDPRACGRILRELHGWCRRHGVRRLADLIGAVHE
ncbi:MAG TPA: dihydroorotate dehydrogenase [Acidimicrobiales bacterium]|nr:dihydroorotate dehydrogenase [Acidimicrobiales bacterium]